MVAKKIAATMLAPFMMLPAHTHTHNILYKSCDVYVHVHLYVYTQTHTYTDIHMSACICKHISALEK